MRCLSGLDEKIRTFQGDPVKITTEIEQCPKCGHQCTTDNEWRVADVFLHVISQARLVGKDAFRLYDVGRKIHQSEGADVTLEDAQFEILNKQVEAFQGFAIGIMVPALRVLENATVSTACVDKSR